MLIAINIGNSSINMGFFEGEEPFVLQLPTQPLRGVQDYLGEIEKGLEKYGFTDRPGAAVLCSVVPTHTGTFEEALGLIVGARKKPLVIGYRSTRDMKFAVETPGDLGADRIAAAYGAWKLYGGPVAVVDAGTATTVNFVSFDGVFLGGAILPGLTLMRDSLSTGTAKLPIVELERVERQKLLSPLGTTTSGSILAGIVYGTAGAVARVLEEAELVRLEKSRVVLTGGHADLLAPYLKRLDYREPALVLKGMRLIYLNA